MLFSLVTWQRNHLASAEEMEMAAQATGLLLATVTLHSRVGYLE
jgi:hypothetical protein